MQIRENIQVGYFFLEAVPVQKPLCTRAFLRVWQTAQIPHHSSDLFLSLAPVIDTSWINPSNALPTLLYHGTCDPLVPFASDIHHYCPDDSPGALMLHGSWSIAGQLESLGMPWQLYTFCGDDHRVANNPFLSNGEDIIRFCRDISEGLLETKHTIFPGDSDCFIDPEFCKVEGIRRE